MNRKSLNSALIKSNHLHVLGWDWGKFLGRISSRAYKTSRCGNTQVGLLERLMMMKMIMRCVLASLRVGTSINHIHHTLIKIIFLSDFNKLTRKNGWVFEAIWTGKNAELLPHLILFLSLNDDLARITNSFKMHSRISLKGCVCPSVGPSVCPSHTNRISEIWAEFEKKNSTWNMTLCH